MRHAGAVLPDARDAISGRYIFAMLFSALLMLCATSLFLLSMLTAALLYNRRLQKIVRHTQQNEARLLGLLDASPYFAAVHDRSERLIYLNPAGRQMLGIPAGTSIDSFDLSSCYPESHKTHFQTVVLPALQEAGFWEGENVYRSADGQAVIVRQTVTADSPDADAAGLFSTIARDITLQRHDEILLKRLRYHVNNTLIAAIEWDEQFRICSWSPAAQRLFGWTEAEVLGKQPDELMMIYDEDKEAVDILIERLVSQSDLQNESFNRNHTRSGSVIHCLWHNSVLLDADGSMISIFSFVMDETERVLTQEALERQRAELSLANARLTELATTDGLTGLYNHRTFQERLSAEVLRRQRSGLPLSLLMLDVDLFKAYNDRYSHPAGDRVLAHVAEQLRMNARATDTVARYGGEEFAVILPETDAASAMEAAERMRIAVAETRWQSRPVTISIGVSCVDTGYMPAVKLIEQADQALYQSKARGRNRVTRYVPPQIPPEE